MQPNGEVHPVADLFPMLPEDELAELAADIKANGLRHPIVLGPDGVLYDGRNRLAGCRMASVEPQFTVFDGDPVAYIISANILHRHLMKGQRAMLVIEAMARSETEQPLRDLAGETGIKLAPLGRAAMVHKYAPDLVPGVISGAEKLDTAYGVAKTRREEAASAETRFERLRCAAPDLAQLVIDESLTLSGAEAVLRQREKEALQRRKSALANLHTALHFTDPWTQTAAERAGGWLQSLDAAPAQDDEDQRDLDPARIRRCAGVLEAMAGLLEDRSNGDGAQQ